MGIKKEIKKRVREAIEAAITAKQFSEFKIPDFDIEIPVDPKLGDYATSVSLKLVKMTGFDTRRIAQIITGFISPSLREICEVSIAGPGFLNFRLKPDFLIKKLCEILNQKEKFGINLEKGLGRVQVEFISANPTGPLHLGHGRGGFLGDVIARIFEARGYKVIKEYYVNDTGGQIEKLGGSIKAALGLLPDQEEFYKGSYILKVAGFLKKKQPVKKIQKMTNSEVGRIAADLILDHFIKPTIKKMKIGFDEWFFESSLYKKGVVKKVLEEFEKKKLSYEEDGAVWFVAKEFGDDQDRVLLRSDGEPTYFLSDIAYHKNKFFDRKFDRVINLWGADHYGYVKRLEGALGVFGIGPGRLKIIVMQLVRLVSGGKEVRMSKRKGEFITLDELISEIGEDVARFFFLMRSPDTHMDFDLDLAKKQSNENPVFYIQYAYARIQSILKKIKNKKPKIKNVDYGLLTHPSELSLIKELIKFPDLFEEISETLEAHRLPFYALGIADKFHKFYESCRVISEDKEMTEARLGLIIATGFVLKNILNLLGISAPKRM